MPKERVAKFAVRRNASAATEKTPRDGVRKALRVDACDDFYSMFSWQPQSEQYNRIKGKIRNGRKLRGEAATKGEP